MPVQEIRQKLAGIWQRAIAVQLVGILVGLLLLLTGWYTALSIARIETRFAQPYAILTTLLLCLADLLLRSPVRAGQFQFYREVAKGLHPPASAVLKGFSPPLYRKAVRLRIKLWKKRLFYTVFALFPPSVLLVCSNRLRATVSQTATVQVVYLLCCLTAAVFLVVGALAVELRMLRYMPAWQLLPEHQKIKDALKQAKAITKGRLGEWVWLYTRFLGWKMVIVSYAYAAPLFAVARAEEIEKSRLAGNDTYNLKPNAHTVKGAVEVPAKKIRNFGGTSYEQPEQQSEPQPE